MSMVVLQNKSQIEKARKELKSQGVSVLEPAWFSILRRLKLIRYPAVGDNLKSWDVLSTFSFLQQNVQKSDRILDIGCFASEILVSLHKAGFTNLVGVDLNPQLVKMPFSDHIKYVNSDFLDTPFEDGSFRAITSISVIEHGFNGEKLLTEMSRLLKVGGYFIASFDYWPDKIETDNIKFFGLDWKIFSQQDVSDFIMQAERFGMFPVGDVKYNTGEQPINCAGKSYTFAWLILKKA